MALAVLSFSRQPERFVASTGTTMALPHFLADLYRAAVLTPDELPTLITLEAVPLRRHLPHIREIGCQGAAFILEALIQGRPLPKEGFPPEVTDAEMVAMATASVMIRLESLPGREGIETLRELQPPAMPTDEEARQFMDRLGLGKGVGRRSAKGLFLEAISTIDRGGVPENTVLDPDQVVEIQSRLASAGFPGLSVPHHLVWEPHRKVRSVGSAKPLFEDPETGTVIVPVFMAPGSVFDEHIHLGREEIILISGQVADALGTVHTPSAIGPDPAIFIEVAVGGIVSTGYLGTTRGAKLLAHYKVPPPRVAALFAGLPPDKETDRPREDVAKYLFALLEGRDRVYERYDDTQWGVERLARMLPAQRVEFVRDKLSRILILPE